MKTKQVLAVLAVWVAGLGASGLAAVIYADSVTGFSGTQGANDWSYTMWYPPAGYLHGMIWDAGNSRWIDSEGAIWATGTHPHGTDWYVVREWTSTVTGDIDVVGTVGLANPGAAGVIVKIIKGYDLAQTQWTATLAGGEGTTHDVSFAVNTGDKVLLAILGNGGIASDATDWRVQITDVPEPAMLSLVALGALAVMQRRRRA